MARVDIRRTVPQGERVGGPMLFLVKLNSGNKGGRKDLGSLFILFNLYFSFSFFNYYV